MSNKIQREAMARLIAPLADADAAADALLESGWLAAHDAEVKADALKSAAHRISEDGIGVDGSYDPAVTAWLRGRAAAYQATATRTFNLEGIAP